jgi:hypothetical protein
MWQSILAASLMACVFSSADEVRAAPSDSSVSVECCGRVRHGVVAIGGETTGTTITFNGIVWELELPNESSQKFVKNHHRESIKVTGKLRRVAGTEAKDRWIIDAKTLSEFDEKKDKEGTRLVIHGTLRSRDARKSDAPELTIDADDQLWPIALSSDVRLQSNAASLIGQPVLLEGSVERDTKDKSSDQIFIRVKSLDRSSKTSAQRAKD